MKKFWKRNSKQQALESQTDDSRQSLAPRILKKGDSSYKSVEELGHAMSLPECRNIALTGVFGSGKSSVINTYLASADSPKNVLRISLSNLLPIGQELKTPEDKIKYENEVEYKIFQQIIHKADYRKTTQSRFFRINVIDTCKTIQVALFCVLFFVCYIIAFEPKVCQIQSFYDAYFKMLGPNAEIVNTVADILAVCVMLVQITVALCLAIPKLYKFRISTLKAGEIEVNFDDKVMLFSKRLGEILYYLKAGKYEAVIFEDLDRVSHSQDLFLKLREINILLNESEYYSKHNRIIRFIYAVKDDLFQNEVRTKFFDYIVPVVPVVDEFNSGEYMICHCKDVLNNIHEIDIKTLGLFVPRMRDLINVINEYRLYKETLNVSSSLSARKLLALIIYKNLYPNDYSLLHEKKGCLHQVFNHKEQFSKMLTSSLEEQRQKIMEEIKSNRDSIYKMRHSILEVLSEKHHITQLSISGTFYKLDDFAKNDSLYGAFEGNKVEMCYIEPTPDEGGGYRKFSYKFDEIRESVDQDDTYYDQMDEYKATLSANESTRIDLDKQIGSIRNMSLGKIMRQVGDGNQTLSTILSICKESRKDSTDDDTVSRLADTIHGLIRNGYISEDYSSYISFAYHGSFGEAEFKFLHSVIQGTPLEYDYKLSNVKAFINDITSENYESRCILNYDLANYIFTKEGTEAQKQNFINTARKYPDFVVGYEKHPNHKDEFFERLFDGWNNCLLYIRDLADNDIRTALLVAYFRIATQTVPLRQVEKEYVNSLYPFICEHFTEFELVKIKRFISHFGMRFTNLLPHNAITVDLYSYVLQFHLFEINNSNLYVIYGEDFKTQALTKVLNGTKNLKDYITQDIELLYKNLPLESKQESESSLVYIVNQNVLSEEQLSVILKDQKEKISRLGDVPSERYQFLLKGDYVVPSWDNVRQYFTQYDELSIVAEYINKHVKQWPVEELKDDDEQLQQLLFNDNTTLSEEAYSILAPCCHYLFEPKQIDGLTENRLGILLDNNLLEYSNEFNQFVSQYSPRLFSKYLIKYYNEFMEDEEQKNFENSNELGIEILHSTLTNTQKSYFLKEYASIITAEGHNDYAEEYSKLICEFYHDNGISTDETDFDLIIKALENYHTEGSWQTRIELINMVHRIVPYVPSRTNRMVVSLGDPYRELVTYASRTPLDDNPQNNELVDYLMAHEPYINKKTPDNGIIKITYHRGNKED